MLRELDGRGCWVVNFRFEIKARGPRSSDDEILSGDG